MSLRGQLLPNTLYISLDSRPLQDEYHWALVSTDADAAPTLRHASNLNGPWKHEVKPFDPRQRMMLIALVRVGSITDPHGFEAICQSQPVDASTSSRTDEPFNCRTWLLDVLVRLDEDGVVRLPMSIDELEDAGRHWAGQYAEVAETGGGATVVQDAAT